MTFLSYAKDPGPTHVEACRFNQYGVRFLKDWPESKPLQDMQVYLGVACFYQRFVHSVEELYHLP